jgi:DNA-binding winged helix-turn-helix (wHTH) protein
MVITEFVKALQKMQLKGVWVLVDGLEAWNDTDQEQLAAGLTTFLSALNLFERGGFAYKMLMPAKLDHSLSRASGIQRRRIDLHRLRWPTHKLIALVEKRLALASKGKVRSLADLCEDEELITWLERCGGNTPRGWLEQIRPLVAAYFERVEAGQGGPISRQEWVEIRQRHPPLLILDKEERQVTIGRREVNDLSAGLFELLEYLYDRSGQICSKSEIYYRLQREMDHEPVSLADPDWEIPKTYEGQIDTMIWRLREALEPNPRNPVFIITVKGRGVRLDNAW